MKSRLTHMARLAVLALFSAVFVFGTIPCIPTTAAFAAGKTSTTNDNDSKDDADDKDDADSKDADDKDSKDDADDKDSKDDADDKDSKDDADDKDSPKGVTKAPNYQYTAKKVGSFKAEKSDVGFYKGAPLIQEGEKVYLIDKDGKKVVDEPIQGVEYLGNDLYVVAIESDDVNNTGLVNADGEILLPFEAATIDYDNSTFSGDSSEANFLEVVYATDETDNKEECFVYSTDKQFSISPESDDTMYKGYAEIYSIEEESIIKGIKITENPSSAMNDLGDSVLVKEGDKKVMYSATGKELWSGDYCNAFYGGIIESTSSRYIIFDDEGKQHFKSADQIGLISGTNEYFKVRDEAGDWEIIDIDGNSMVDEHFKTINYGAGGLFDVGEGADENVIDVDGNVVVKTSSSVLKEVLPGYCTTKANNEYVLIASGKEATSGTDGNFSNLVIYNSDKDYYVINDGKYSLNLESGYELDTALVRGRGEDDVDYCLYDLFTGERVIDGEFETIEFAGDYIYAFADGEWTTYEIDLED